MAGTSLCRNRPAHKYHFKRPREDKWFCVGRLLTNTNQLLPHCLG